MASAACTTHCYHSGRVFKHRAACCRCSSVDARRGGPEREEKSHGFAGCGVGPDYPIFTSIDRKVAARIREEAKVDAECGRAREGDADFLDVLSFVETLDSKLRRPQTLVRA
jgi:hypothetical protein